MKISISNPLDLPASGFQFDPKAARPARLKKVIALVAAETEAVVSEQERSMGRPQCRRLFSTFTYARNSKGKPGDLSQTLKRLREWLRRRGRPMVPLEWVGETQERGALHYHMLMWWPKDLYLPKFDQRGWWEHGSTKIERARNPVGYLVKYASKFKDSVKRFRKGTRLYGYAGLSPDARERVRRARMARWMRQRVDAKLESEWQEAVEFEIAQQEHEEAALLHAWFPDEHPDPGEFESEQEADERMVDAWERQAVMERLRRRGWDRFTRCVGGFVDKLTGELSATPWAAAFRSGVLWVWPKEAV